MANAPPAPERLCRLCRGSGVCPRCNAAGRVHLAGQALKCLACRGTTVCPECRGSGWVREPPRPPPRHP